MSSIYCFFAEGHGPNVLALRLFHQTARVSEDLLPTLGGGR